MLEPQSLAPVADALDERRSRILEAWRERVQADRSLDEATEWSRKQFYDHFPDVLEHFVRILRRFPEPSPNAEGDQESHAHSHAKTRWLQGYSLRALIREWGHFNTEVVSALGHLEEEEPARGRTVEAMRIWSELANDQLTISALEYHRLLQAEAETRAQELSSLLGKFRDLNQVRARMLGTMAEGLRSDLSTVLTSSSLADSATGDTDRAELREMVRAGTSSVDRVLGDMVLLARLEAGLETREVATFDAGETLMLLTAGMLPQAESSLAQLTWGGPEHFPVEGDARHVGLIARYLLQSGLQSELPGPVDVEWREDERDAQRWVLVVRQHSMPVREPVNPPISREIAVATDRAQQAQGVPPTGYEQELQDGIIPVASRDGVTLMIAKHLCELLHASLELEAREGIVTYRVSFPRAYNDG